MFAGPRADHLAELLVPLVAAVFVEGRDVGPRFVWFKCDRLQRSAAIAWPLLHPAHEVEHDLPRAHVSPFLVDPASFVGELQLQIRKSAARASFRAAAACDGRRGVGVARESVELDCRLLCYAI